MPSSNYRKPRFPSSWIQRTCQENSKNLAGGDDHATCCPAATASSRSCFFSEFIQQYNLQCRQNRFITSLANSSFFTKDDESCTNGTVASSTTRTGGPDNAATRCISTTSSSNRCCSSHDIALLEPHLAAFRKQQQQCQLTITTISSSIMEPQECCEPNRVKSNAVTTTSTTTTGAVGSTDSIPTIPPQLLRIIRFFPLKWYPIKRALLRPPSENEVGVNIRLSLVQIMHDKQLISTAEYDALEQQVVYHSNPDGNKKQGEGPKEKKRKRDIVGIAHALKIAFSRLPLDRHCWKKNVNVNGLDHLRFILEDYCAAYNHDGTNDRTTTGDSNENVVPLPDQVAEWALLSFCGLVIANGLDEESLWIKHHFTMESQMVSLMTNETSKTSVFVQAVKRRVECMLEPPIVNELSDLNVLCLARFLSYLDVGVTDRLFAHGLSVCFGLGIDSGRSGGGGGGIGGNTCLSLQQLSKLIASYVSIVVNNRGRKQGEAYQNLEKEISSPSFLLALQSRIKQRLELMLEQQDKRIKDNLEKKNKFEKFTNLFFQTVEYMLLQ